MGRPLRRAHSECASIHAATRVAILAAPFGSSQYGEHTSSGQHALHPGQCKRSGRSHRQHAGSTCRILRRVIASVSDMPFPFLDHGSRGNRHGQSRCHVALCVRQQRHPDRGACVSEQDAMRETRGTPTVPNPHAMYARSPRQAGSTAVDRWSPLVSYRWTRPATAAVPSPDSTSHPPRYARSPVRFPGARF